MKMTIVLTTMKKIEKNQSCRICFSPPPFSVVEHQSCHHEAAICVDCFSKWYHSNGHCDFCRQRLFQTFSKFYIINDDKTKIYYQSKNFFKALKDISKKDLYILKLSLQNFKKNFNLIEKYEFEVKKEKKVVFFFKIINGNLFTTLKLYLLLCEYKKLKET